MPRIVFTGGGSAGHVTPNIALFPEFKNKGWDIHYIGSKDGIEQSLIADVNISYHTVAVGKLRRYFDIKNMSDPFRVVKGIAQAYRLIRKLKPNVVFSKGGFVSVPVVIGAWLNRVPVILHESDITPGLANRLALRFATRICTTFPETIEHLPEGKAEWCGTPIRGELSRGNRQRGLGLCGFENGMPVIMVMGGSQGAQAINECVRKALPELLKRFQIVHLCGRGNVAENLTRMKGYKQFDYVTTDLPDIFACSDLMISRAGANSIFEILSLAKPNLLIPLSREVSRGDQILNARSFHKQGFSMVLFEENMDVSALVQSVDELFENRDEYISAMKVRGNIDSINKIVGIIEASVII